MPTLETGGIINNVRLEIGSTSYIGSLKRVSEKTYYFCPSVRCIPHVIKPDEIVERKIGYWELTDAEILKGVIVERRLVFL